MGERKACRFCGSSLTDIFIDLGMSPLANFYPDMQEKRKEIKIYPLCTYVCKTCFLVQLEEFESHFNIFTDYAYFSSYSETWLQHVKWYAKEMVQKLSLNEKSNVIEIASNDGYLLQYFQEKGIPVLGIEPAKNVAKIAKDKGISTITEFFGSTLARQMKGKEKLADLLIGNNVLAHVPDINDFVEGLRLALKPEGVITMEFPHLMNLIARNQFDTIYHEHFSYLSFYTVKKIFEAHALKIFDVEEWKTHGGSLRIYACHERCRIYREKESVSELLNKEYEFGIPDISTYLNFEKRVFEIKFDLLKLLIELKKENKNIVAYGAPAKGNTLLNYCGIGREFIEYTVDMNPYKQGKCLSGSCIPIYSVEKIKETKPDYILILPWNLREEIMRQLFYTKEWGGKFILAIPQVEVV